MKKRYAYPLLILFICSLVVIAYLGYSLLLANKQVKDFAFEREEYIHLLDVLEEEKNLLVKEKTALYLSVAKHYKNIKNVLSELDEFSRGIDLELAKLGVDVEGDSSSKPVGAIEEQKEASSETTPAAKLEKEENAAPPSAAGAKLDGEQNGEGEAAVSAQPTVLFTLMPSGTPEAISSPAPMGAQGEEEAH